MTLTFINPELFDSSVQLTMGFITALLAAGTLYYTSMMYVIAKAALNSWKDQDRHKVTIELIKASIDTHALIEALRRSNDINITDQTKLEIDEKFQELGYLGRKSHNLSEKLKDNETLITEIKRLAVTAIALLENEHPLRLYFVFINRLLADTKSRNITLWYGLSGWLHNRKIRNQLRVELEEAKLGGTESTVDDLEVKLKKAEDDFFHGNETVRALEKLLFPRILDSPDELSLELSEKYEKVQQFIESYSNPKNNL